MATNMGVGHVRWAEVLARQNRVVQRKRKRWYQSIGGDPAVDQSTEEDDKDDNTREHHFLPKLGINHSQPEPITHYFNRETHAVTERQVQYPRQPLFPSIENTNFPARVKTLAQPKDIYYNKGYQRPFYAYDQRSSDSVRNCLQYFDENDYMQRNLSTKQPQGNSEIDHIQTKLKNNTKMDQVQSTPQSNMKIDLVQTKAHSGMKTEHLHFGMKIRKKWSLKKPRTPIHFFTAPQTGDSIVKYGPHIDRTIEPSIDSLSQADYMTNKAKYSKLDGDIPKQSKNVSSKYGALGLHNSVVNSLEIGVLQNSGELSSENSPRRERKKWIQPDHWANQAYEDVRTSGKPKSARTPRKSKRMAARLDGLSSTDIESSRSVTESREGQQKSEDKSDVGRSQEKSSKINSEAKPKRSEQKPSISAAKVEEPAVSEQVQLQQVSLSDSITQSQDDIPMLQKLKDMNKKDQSSFRKKEIPKWLKHDSIAPFENPAESKDSSIVDKKGNSSVETTTAPLKKEEVDMLIDEELSMWPQRGKDHLSTVLDNEQGTDSKKLATVSEEGLPEGVDTVTPMQRIQKNRAKWRETQNLNLEESWGSLSRFKQSQKGRLSLDMDDDYILSDEYLNPPKKQEPTIAEEDAELENLLAEAEEEEMDDGFVIPELPSGKELVINILTTWGDRHYVGLTGIDIFSSTGEPVSVAKISAEPKDINVLSEYEKDPRVVSNIIDGVNRTRDDIHMWLTPFTPGSNHLVFITFDKPCKIALMRIWNYNKSRIHSYRGAKDVVISLDNVVIFKGEIARACGGVEGGTEAFGDTILFTTDEAILDSVSKNDESYEGEMLSDDEPFDVPFERPPTAEGDDRPFTRAVGNVKTPIKEVPIETSREETFLMACEGDVVVYKGKFVELNFTSTWGDPHYLGLTGLEVVGKDGEALPVKMSMLTANPRDVRSLPGHEKDDRTLEKLIDGTNVTISDEHMWLIPFTEGQNHTLTIDFGQTVLMAGLRFWNYNKSREDTYRGAKIVHVKVDGKVISPPSGYLIRKGPGVCHFDFAQEISFAPNSNNSSDVPNPFSGQVGTNDDIDDAYEYVQMPSGFIYQFQMFSTWGDPYYVGLNGIEFYDASFKKIQLTQSNISAYPDSVNVLDNVTNDVRTPDKLIDGCNDSTEGNHSWLAPILPNILNRVYVIFDQLTTVSMVKIWNYSKTPQRGAKDFALLVDDLLVYNGELKAVPHVARGIVPTAQASQPYHTIIFTNKKEILKREKNTIISNQGLEQDIQMTNDMKIVSHYADPKKAQSGKPVDQAQRPKTSVTSQMKMMKRR
ncbi:hypothetical protein ACJMK2_034603 [Sinanodonta woodiana]|uniref:KATNIP domain-containing protein n=1 Tax=Sinanodonta woodiana TaxID=1069815 RepID=A0ABD3WS64_SINWO